MTCVVMFAPTNPLMMNGTAISALTRPRHFRVVVSAMMIAVNSCNPLREDETTLLRHYEPRLRVSAAWRKDGSTWNTRDNSGGIGAHIADKTIPAATAPRLRAAAITTYPTRAGLRDRAREDKSATYRSRRKLLCAIPRNSGWVRKSEQGNLRIQREGARTDSRVSRSSRCHISDFGDYGLTSGDF